MFLIIITTIITVMVNTINLVWCYFTWWGLRVPRFFLFFLLYFLKRKLAFSWLAVFHTFQILLHASAISWEAFCSKPGCTVTDQFLNDLFVLCLVIGLIELKFTSQHSGKKKGKDLWTTEAFQRYCKGRKQTWEVYSMCLMGQSDSYCTMP